MMSLINELAQWAVIAWAVVGVRKKIRIKLARSALDQISNREGG